MIPKVGMITKQWTGFAKEAFTDSDNFGISFPLDLDVKVAFMVNFPNSIFNFTGESHSARCLIPD